MLAQLTFWREKLQEFLSQVRSLLTPNISFPIVMITNILIFTSKIHQITTATLVEGASELAETVNIPTLSVELAVGCIFSQPGESAICQSVIGSGTAKVTDFETVVFSPFPVAIGTDSAISGSGSASSVLSSSASASSASASSTPSSATGSIVSASSKYFSYCFFIK